MLEDSEFSLAAGPIAPRLEEYPLSEPGVPALLPWPYTKAGKVRADDAPTTKTACHILLLLFFSIISHSFLSGPLDLSPLVLGLLSSKSKLCAGIRLDSHSQTRGKDCVLLRGKHSVSISSV